MPNDAVGVGAAALIGLLVTAGLVGCASDASSNPVPAATTGPLSEKAQQEQRQAILKMSGQTLNQLYKLKPSTRAEIAQAAGHGVFEINGLNAVLAGAHGRGVLFDKTGKATYMQMVRTDLSPGATVSPYWQVLVFRDPQQFTTFRAAQTPTAISGASAPTVYHLGEKGVSTQSDGGARYVRHPHLNAMQ